MVSLDDHNHIFMDLKEHNKQDMITENLFVLQKNCVIQLFIFLIGL